MAVPGTAWATGGGGVDVAVMLFSLGLFALPAALWSGVTAVTSTRPEWQVFLQRCGGVVLGLDLIAAFLFTTQESGDWGPFLVLQFVLLPCLGLLYAVHRLVLHRGRKALARGDF
jgi:hypothetical protein